MPAFEIDAHQVRAVLLLDGWYAVDPGTFAVGTFEIVKDGEEERHQGGAAFTFVKSGGDRITGPLASILAIRH